MKTTLRGKIMGGYVLVTAIAVAVGLWSAHNYLRFSGELNTIMVQNYRSVVAASHLVASLERQDSAALLMLLGDQASEPLFERARADFLAWFARAEDNITLPGEGEVVADIRSRYGEYSLALQRLRWSRVAGGMTPEQVSAVYRQNVLPAFNLARDACQALLRINDEAMREAQNRMTAATARAAWSTLTAGVAALVVAITLGFTISEVIARPVRRLAESARRVGEGHLEPIVEVAGADEVAVLAREFSGMVDKLREVRASHVAQLVAAQRKLGAVIDAIADGLVVTDTDYRIESVNPVAREIFGWNEGEAVGRHFSEMVTDERLFQLLEQEAGHRPPAGTGREAWLLERKRDERTRHYLAQALPVYHRGDLLGLVLWLRDVTVFEEAERSKSDFMSTISHELRTPLASLTMGIGLLAESRLLKGQKREAELLKMLKEDSRRLSRLVDELFELSRLQSGQLPLSFAAVPVKELLETAVLPFVAQAESQGVTLKRDVPPDIPPVRADREKIVWVISNLVANALRYTPSGGRVTVWAERDGRRVYVHVSDTGSGIARDKQEEIFRPYVQLEGPKGAAGLGLSIARDVVRAHGGRIWVESEPGKGADFVFSLMVEEGAAARAETVSDNAAGGEGSAAEDTGS